MVSEEKNNLSQQVEKKITYVKNEMFYESPPLFSHQKTLVKLNCIKTKKA